MTIINAKTETRSQAGELIAMIQRRGRKLGPLLIMTHDHPDPDGLASAWALSHLIKSFHRVRTRIVYGGALGRGENRLMLECLEVPAYPFRKSDKDAAVTALVDTQPPFKNNRYDPRRHPDILIDHHPRHPKTGGAFIHIDTSIGATTTLLAEALLEAKVPVPKKLSTAIVYGITSETQNLGREANPRDVAAYLAFLPKANMKALWRINNPPRTASFFQMLYNGIRDAFVCRRIIGVHLREVPTPDRVGQMADFLLSHETMRWCIVTGRYHGRLHVSLRTHSLTDHAGWLLRSMLGGGNRGGGHRLVAGGSVKVGLEAPEEKWREAENKVVATFLKRRGIKNSPQLTYPFRNSG
ncbi:MAG: DHH family phosphoesterase [Elusimicrobiota bacterium]